MKYTIRDDEYRKSRGGKSTLYKIYCSDCRKRICVYQKDGAGILMRMYVDRMVDIFHTSGYGFCPCGNWYGVPYIFEKEDRPAIKLFVGKVYKRKYE